MKKKTGVKRLLALALTVMMTASVFIGCGKKETAQPASTQAEAEKTQGKSAAADQTQSQEQITLQFWTISLSPTFNDFFNGLNAKYEQDHKNIKIKWTDLPYDAIQNKLVTAAAGGTAPDVVNLNTELALAMAGKDILVNLEKEATEGQKSIYIKTLFESAKTSKGIFAFPWYGAPNVLVYNKELLSKAGIQNPPATFDEMLTLGKGVKQKTGAYMYIPYHFRTILWLEGVPLLNEDGTKAAFNTPEALELLNKYKKAADEQIIPKADWGSWDKMLQQFNTGKLIMMNSGPQSLKRIQAEAPNIYKNIEVAPSMTGKAGIIENSIMNLVVPEISKHHKEAIEFAVYITNDENQLAFSKTVAIFPSTVKASQDSFFKSDTSTLEKKAISIAAGILPKTADLSLGTSKQSEIFTAINNASQAVVLGNSDAKKALDDAEKKVNELLASEQ